MNHDRTIVSVLNSLIRVNNLRIHEYEKAMQQVAGTKSDLRILFMNMIDQSRRFRNELGTEVQSRGFPMDHSQAREPGLLSRITNIFSSHGSENALKHCCRQETMVQQEYDNALGNEMLPSYLRELLNRQKDELNGSWQEMKSFQQH